jgi:hypothetical protein
MRMKKRKRKREREHKRASDYSSKPPGSEWKICELYCTYCTGKSGIVCSSQSLGIVTYILPAEFKIARENRYVWKISMSLVSTVCRPAGYK